MYVHTYKVIFCYFRSLSKEHVNWRRITLRGITLFPRGNLNPGRMVEEAQTLDWGVAVVACCVANDRYPPKLVKINASGGGGNKDADLWNSKGTLTISLKKNKEKESTRTSAGFCELFPFICQLNVVPFIFNNIWCRHLKLQVKSHRILERWLKSQQQFGDLPESLHKNYRATGKQNQNFTDISIKQSDKDEWINKSWYVSEMKYYHIPLKEMQ